MISKVPPWLKQHVVGNDHFEFKGVRHRYVIVSAQFGVANGAPEIFTIYLPAIGVLAISEQYPWWFRKFGLIHELLEHRAAEPLDCLSALKQELKLVKEAELNEQEYLIFRRDFFAAMVQYYERKPALAPNEAALLAGLRASKQHLDSLVPTAPTASIAPVDASSST